MDSLIETLSATLLLTTLFLAPVVLFTLLYMIKCHGFYVNANCWFCNGWTKVLYKNRNSFECPTCLQYNGFNEDGGYNKTIDAQYNIPEYKLKNSVKKTQHLSNGLCTYCNNNQQLKVQQLANFVPLNEHNYDAEVEHFLKLLEKSYKLCKRCDKILKTKIESQHAWIFGNKIKYSRNNLSVPNVNQSSHDTSLRFIAYMLVLFLLILGSLAMGVKIDHRMHEIQKYVPDVFVPYRTLFYDFYHLLRNASRNIIDSLNQVHEILPNNGKFKINSLVPNISVTGFLLEILLLIWDQRPVWWKINETLGWLILIITSLVPFNKSHFIYVLQVFCAFAIIFSLIATIKFSNKRSPVKKKLEFKKLKSNIEVKNSSEIDEDSTEEYSDLSVPSEKLSSNRSIKGNEPGDCQSAQFTFQNILGSNYMENTASPNESFSTARSTKTTSVCNSSLKNESGTSYELHNSLDNLHLSNLNIKLQRCESPMVSLNSINRPILSPPKLKNVTQNSWTAGGFWKNDISAFSAASDFTNLSRSSSQSSGFISNNEPLISNYFSSLPPSRDSSICGDFERASLLSEPAYHFKPINSKGLNTNQTKNNVMCNSSQGSKLSLSPQSNQLYYKAENNKFYPILNQNNLLFIQGTNQSHNKNKFNNLSLKGFNTTNGFISPALFGERPVISSLFKNLSGVSPQSHRFRMQNC